MSLIARTHLCFQAPVFIGATSELEESKIKELYEVFFTIDEHYFPNGNEWIAGENVSVADFAYVATFSTLIVSFVLLCKWLESLVAFRIKAVIYFPAYPRLHYCVKTKLIRKLSFFLEIRKWSNNALQSKALLALIKALSAPEN